MTLRSWLRRVGPETGVVALLVAVIAVPPWPGIFTVDSQSMLKMARLGEVDDWYSPILVSLWRAVDAIGLPPATIFVATAIAVVTALLAIYRLALPRWWALVATAGTVLFPPVYGLLGWVGRDVWFLALVLIVAAALGWACVLPQRRVPLVLLAFVAAWFAADARQNGFPVLAVVAGVAAWFAFSTRRGRWLLVIGASALTVVLGLGAQRAARVVAVQRDVAIEQALYYQDLLAVSLRLDESLVPRRLLRRNGLADVRKLWVPSQVGEILFRDDPPVLFRRYHFTPDRLRELRDAWIDMIRDHPDAYIAERAALYRRLLGVGGADVPGAYYAVSDDLRWEGSAALRQRFTGLNDARVDYLQVLESGTPGTGGPLHKAWIYLLLGLAGAGAIIAAGPRLRVFGWAMVAVQISLQLVLFFAAPLLEYRFELFQVVLGIALAVLGARAWFVARHRGPARRDAGMTAVAATS